MKKKLPVTKTPAALPTLQRCVGRPGRPPDASLEGRILAAAGALMMTRGFGGTTMDEIAKAARVSKLTMYRRFPDKRSLLKRVVEEKCRMFLPPETFALPPGTSPTKALEQVGVQLLSLITDQEAVNVVRMLMAEGPKMPEVVEDFFQTGPRPVKQKMAEMLVVLRQQGVLSFTDANEARDSFYGLVVGSHVFEILLDPTFRWRKGALRRHVQVAVGRFMQAYAPAVR
jgi:AcrR family transcriptional regulator